MVGETEGFVGSTVWDGSIGGSSIQRLTVFEVSGYIGGKVALSRSGAITLKGVTDKCNGIDTLALRGCFSNDVGGNISIGGSVTFRWGKWDTTVAVEGFGRVSVGFDACVTCGVGGCNASGSFAGVKYSLGARACFSMCVEWTWGGSNGT